jgi:predicted nicotinamide N-methyase
VLHTTAVLSHADEAEYLGTRGKLPYGVALWPASIALAHDIAGRDGAFHKTKVLELGAGTGLPGLVAESRGAQVVQTDRQEVALAMCRRNAERNGATNVAVRYGNWTAWTDAERYDWIIGSDILYSPSMHDPLRNVFSTALAPGGAILLADPFRPLSFPFLESLDADGWSVSLAKWTIGEGEEARGVGVFECRRRVAR